MPVRPRTRRAGLRLIVPLIGVLTLVPRGGFAQAHEPFTEQEITECKERRHPDQGQDPAWRLLHCPEHLQGELPGLPESGIEEPPDVPDTATEPAAGAAGAPAGGSRPGSSKIGPVKEASSGTASATAGQVVSGAAGAGEGAAGSLNEKELPPAPPVEVPPVPDVLSGLGIAKDLLPPPSDLGCDPATALATLAALKAWIGESADLPAAPCAPALPSAGTTPVPTDAIASAAGAATSQETASVFRQQQNGESDIAVEKVATQEGVPVFAVSSGEQFVYRITISNNGPDPAEGITLEDEVPLPLEVLGVDSAFCMVAGQLVSCDFGATLLDPGDEIVINITVLVPEDFCTDNEEGPSLKNTATVHAENDPETCIIEGLCRVDSNDSDSTFTRVACSNVVIEKEIEDGLGIEFDPGQQIVFLLAVRNVATFEPLSPALGTATGVMVRDELPEGVALAGEVTTDQGTCDVDANNVVECELGSLAPVDPGTDEPRVEIRIPVRITANCDELLNTATVEALNEFFLHEEEGNSDSVRFLVNCTPDLALTKTANPASLTNGGSVTFTITVTNHGTAEALGVTVEDQVDSRVTITGTTASGGGSCTTSNNLVTCTLPGILPGQTATVTITGTVPASACPSVKNAASVSAEGIEVEEPQGGNPILIGGEPEGLLGDNSGEVEVPVACPVSLTVVKVNDADRDGIYNDSEQAPKAGAEVPFRATITNTSAITVQLTVVTDAYSAVMIPVCANLVTLQLLAGGSTTCDFTLPAYSPAAGGTIENRVAATAIQVGVPANAATASDVSFVSTVEVLGGGTEKEQGGGGGGGGGGAAVLGGLAVTGANLLALALLATALLLSGATLRAKGGRRGRQRSG